MTGEVCEEKSADWPGAGLLLLCGCLVAAGLVAAILRGPAPAGEVSVRLVPAAAAEVPAQP